MEERVRDVRGEVVADDETIALIENPDSTEEIPTLDLASYLEGRPGGLESVAAQLREISMTVGFFYLKNHGLPQSVIDQAFAESRRFHNLPEVEKRKNPWHAGPLEKIGYQPIDLRESYEELGHVSIVEDAQPSMYSQFVFVLEPEAERAALNAWPENLPGFRETVLNYAKEVEKLARKFLPLWCHSLNLPRDYLDPYFEIPHLQTGLLHYPPQKETGNRRFGITPHTDNAFMTLLAQSEISGLAVRMPSGHWRTVDVVPGTLVVNTGNSIVAWTNEEYLSTKHRVINTNAVDRYSIPVFFGPSDDAKIKALPTCTGATRPPLYEPLTYGEMRSWYFGGRDKWRSETDNQPSTAK